MCFFSLEPIQFNLSGGREKKRTRIGGMEEKIVFYLYECEDEYYC
jgi:hypothetical protein